MSHQARKRFGQNFLQDEAIIGRIIKAIHPEKRAHLIEIGPGLGALTRFLKAAPKLTVIEIDRDLVARLRLEENERFQVVEADVLSIDFNQFANDAPFTVAGNLPYNISTPLIFHLFKYIHLIDELFFMLQKEVVDRMAAKPGNKAYGRLSVMTQYVCEVMPVIDVPATAFSPVPKVESSFVKLKPWAQSPYPLIEDHERFATIVQLAFGQRRKTLRNALRTLEIDLPAEFASKRAEQLSVADFCKLCLV
jgi:16S rRNA (adenine1518-N6/adenine1519-N6)-dimethyltransferase